MLLRCGDAAVALVVFDVLRLEGTSTLREPYWKRRDILESLELAGPCWSVVPAFDNAEALWQAFRVGLRAGIGALAPAAAVSGVPGRVAASERTPPEVGRGQAEDRPDRFDAPAGSDRDREATEAGENARRREVANALARRQNVVVRVVDGFEAVEQVHDYEHRDACSREGHEEFGDRGQPRPCDEVDNRSEQRAGQRVAHVLTTRASARIAALAPLADPSAGKPAEGRRLVQC
jgi:hypothetical protein